MQRGQHPERWHARQRLREVELPWTITFPLPPGPPYRFDATIANDAGQTVYVRGTVDQRGAIIITNEETREMGCFD